MTLRRTSLIACLVLFLGMRPAIVAQTSDPALTKRLSGVEEAIRSLEKEVAELSALLRAALPPPPPPPSADIPPVQLNLAGSPVKGAATAKIVLVEFSDFECPYCGRHVQTAYRDIQRQYVDTGKIRYVFRHLPLEQIHPSARKAAEASECARDQGKFWEFHDRLFVNQKALGVADLSNHAREEKLDMTRFQPCLDEGRMAGKVAGDMKEAERLQVASTPAFFIGEAQADGSVRISRKVTGAQPFQVFQAALDTPLAAPPPSK
jgi:protein-disulfide isomerase